jgi:hypothetical protein|uniref:Putative chloroplast RF1 n=1 Tax=Botryococcus braunii Showa TaxID=1202541 RepID=A0A161KRY9_BOTBR|nr:putative chloroplast RF1 [Botryococcus braunii Showa]
MSFVTTLRDYVDIINSASDSLSGNLTIQEFSRQTVLYLVESLKLGIASLFNGQWIRDLAFLPIKIPNLSLSIFQETFIPGDSPFFSNLSFSETPSLFSNKLLVGFANSFFACLPLTASHVLSGRRLFVQGVPAGLASGFGTAMGQVVFLVFVVLGIRPLVIPWLSLQPISFLITFAILFSIVYSIAHQRSFQVVKISERSTLLRFFVLNFFLSWCEQSSFFQHLGNISINPGASFLESYSSASSTSSLLSHLLYLIGFLIGSCFFTILFAFGSLFARDMWLKLTSTGMSRLIQRINFWSMAFLIALSLSSLPFYGVDLLFAKPLGLLPEEKSLRGTLLWPNTVAELEWFLPQNRNHLSKQGDASPWDTGLYLHANGTSGLALAKDRKIGEDEINSQFQTIEELNYGGEYAWASAEKRRGAPQRETVESFGKWLKDIFSSGEVVHETISNKGDTSQSYRNGQGAKKSRDSVESVASPVIESFFSDTEELANEEFFSDSFKPSKDTSPNITKSKGLFTWDTGGHNLKGFDGHSRPARGTTAAQALPEPASQQTPFALEKIKAFFYTGSPIKPAWKSLADWSNDEIEFENVSDDQESQYISDTALIKERVLEDVAVEEMILQPTTLGLSPFFQADTIPREPLQALLIKRFYETGVYKNALNLDIDSFLSRQPKSYLLSPSDQIELLEKQQSLAKYYETLRAYDRMRDFELFEEFFAGSKSYATKFYNQQFKGTLKIVRRLFSVDLDSLENPRHNPPLAYDQPLFLDTLPKNKAGTAMSMEEFRGEKRKSTRKRFSFDSSHEELKNTAHKEFLGQEGFSQGGTKKKKGRRKNVRVNETPFLEIGTSRPLYSGWDEQSKKLVLTTRFLPRSYAGFEIFSFGKEALSNNEYPTLKKLLQRENTETITFTSWPMPSKVFVNQEDVQQLGKKYELMYGPELKDLEMVALDDETEEEKERKKWRMATLPLNIGPASTDSTNFLWKVFPPDRGGIVWSGSDNVKFDVQKIFKIR